MKKRQGISLIVLIITIIVIVVLASAVILSISNNNPIENATKAVKANDEATQKEWEMLFETEWQTNQYLNKQPLEEFLEASKNSDKIDGYEKETITGGKTGTEEFVIYEVKFGDQSTIMVEDSIDFSVNGTSLMAAKGMTWQDFISSKLNDIDGKKIKLKDTIVVGDIYGNVSTREDPDYYALSYFNGEEIQVTENGFTHDGWARSSDLIQSGNYSIYADTNYYYTDPILAYSYPLYEGVPCGEEYQKWNESAGFEFIYVIDGYLYFYDIVVTPEGQLDISKSEYVPLDMNGVHAKSSDVIKPYASFCKRINK